MIITPHSKRWNFRYSRPITKKRNDISLGAYPEISLLEARTLRDAFRQEIEADESDFGGTRKGKQSRGAAGKTAVFGEKVKPDNIVYTDFYRSYDVLDVSEFHHFRINHSTHFAENQNHINFLEPSKTPFT